MKLAEEIAHHTEREWIIECHAMGREHARWTMSGFSWGEDSHVREEVSEHRLARALDLLRHARRRNPQALYRLRNWMTGQIVL